VVEGLSATIACTINIAKFHVQSSSTKSEMKLLAAFSVFLLLLMSVSGFLVAPSPASRRYAAPVTSMVNKKTVTTGTPEAEDRKKPDPRTAKGLLQILITGSPDGIALIGRPQHNWVTGEKEYTASKGPQKYKLFGKKETK
jgi:hypothetical protein